MNTINKAYKDCKNDRKSNSFFDSDFTKQNVHNISELWGFLTIIVILLLGQLTRYNFRDNLPKALSNSDIIHHANNFIAERAFRDLSILTTFSPRLTGSYNNEVLAVDFLKREISYITQLANRNQKIELDVQVVSGAYWIDYKPQGMTTVYRNMQNVIVKLHGQHDISGNHSLMINCHFDTVAGSPGASDDGLACCVMLEILRVLSRQNYVNQHSIIFLFNGAEETPLQASHGFITQHKWAKEIKAFINLDSIGSGGKELLFQSGPQHPWLVKLYGKAAPHPNAQAAAEEVFQSGLIPADTDYRIFRDFGNIPGLDFAYVINAYRYHTKYDHIDYIPKETIQHTGDNILELTKIIANSDELKNTEKYAEGTVVYFDVLGLFFISYPKNVGTILNCIVVFLSTTLPYYFLLNATKGINRKHIIYEMFLGILINLISFIGAFILCFIIAFELDYTGNSMSWYSNSILLVTMYCCSTLITQLLAHQILNTKKKVPLSLALRVQSRLNGTNIFWGILTAALTLAGYRIAYIFMIPLLITLLTNIISGILGYQNSVLKWLYIYIFGQAFVWLWATHYYHLLIGLFIPLAGGIGGDKNPDFMIGVICCLVTCFATSFITPLVILLKRTKYIFISLILVYAISRIYFIELSPYGFQYRDETNGEPTVQRHYITNAVRKFYDKDGNIKYSDSGYWLKDFDRNAKTVIQNLFDSEILITQEESNLCKDEIFCGLPMYSSRQFHAGSFWIPGPPPLIREEGTLKHVGRVDSGDGIHRLNFVLTGNYLMALHIHPKESVELSKWSLMENLPPPNSYLNKRAYFVMVSNGLEAQPLNISLEFQTNNQNKNYPLVDISLVTFHWENHKEHTTNFVNLLDKFPKWAFAVPSVASLTSFTF